MRIGKSLFLGSAASIIAVTAGQAADLPVKAKPVEYVKVCSLYGAGFFYIPGTDKCIKLGGFMREQWDYGGSNGDGQVNYNSQGRFTRTDSSGSAFRTRTGFTIDVREQSAYGTIRGYTAFGAQQTAPYDSFQSSLYFTRSFVQFAGFTGGRAVSFFDLLSFDPYGLANNIRPNMGNTGATGIDVFAYTLQLGNGASFTVSAEDACGGFPGSSGAAGGSSDRGCSVINSSIASSTNVGVATYANSGQVMPDIVAAARVDQAWGTAQIMGAAHHVAAGYYGASTTFNQNLGHPGDREGWAVGAGFILNNVLGMRGDQFGLQANYSVGAVGYLGGGLEGASSVYTNGANGFGNSVTFAHVVDGMYTSGAAGSSVTGSGIELTTGWTFGGFFEHHWSPQWKTALYGGYISITYDSTAAGYYCGTATTVGTVTTYTGGSLTSGGQALTGTCNPNSQYGALGFRTMWNPNSNLDLGVDFVWDHIATSSSGSIDLPAEGARPGGFYNIAGNNNIFVAAIRAQYNFLP